MPITIPRAQRQQIQSRGPVVQFDPRAPRAPDVGGALSAASEQVSRVAALERAKQDRAELVGLEAELVAWENQQIFDPEAGAISRKGSAAFGLAEQYLPEYEKFTGELGQRSTSPRVRAAFNELVGQRRGSLERNLQRHESTEREAHYDSMTAAQLTGLANQVAANPLDPETRATALTRSEWAVRDQATRKGLSPEATEQAVLAAGSSIHRQAIAGMVTQGRYAEAAGYFTENRSLMTAQDMAAVDGPVREGQVRALSQQHTDAILAEHGAGSGALQAARRIEDPDVRKAVEADIRSRITEAETLRNIAEARAADQAGDIVERTGDWRQVPLDVWMTVPHNVRESLRSGASNKPTGDEGWLIYHDLKIMAADPASRDVFMQTDLYKEAFPHMGRTEFKELVNLQASLVKGGTDELEKLNRGILTQKQIVDTALVGLGIPTTPKTKTEAAKVRQFREAVENEVLTLQATTGKPASTKDVQEIVDRLTVDVTFKDASFLGFDVTKPRYRVTPEDIAKAPRISTEAEFAELPSGAVFVDPEGKTRVKP